MANTNPAGPNQPMNQHPFPITLRYGVGGGCTLTDMFDQGDGDFLLLEAPEDPDVLLALSPLLQSSFFNGVGVVTYQAYLIDKDDKKYVIATETVAASSQNYSLSFVPMYMTKGDFKALYMNISGNTGGAPLSAFVSYFNERNVTRYKAEINDQEYTPISPPITEPGTVGIWTQMFQFALSSGGIANFDSIPHNITYDITDNQGNSVPFAITVPVTAPASLNPNGNEALMSFTQDFGELFQQFTSIVVPSGYSIRAKLDEPVVDYPVEVWTYFQMGNQGPVKTYQGGAY